VNRSQKKAGKGQRGLERAGDDKKGNRLKIFLSLFRPFYALLGPLDEKE